MTESVKTTLGVFIIIAILFTLKKIIAVLHKTHAEMPIRPLCLATMSCLMMLGIFSDWVLSKQFNTLDDLTFLFYIVQSSIVLLTFYYTAVGHLDPYGLISEQKSRERSRFYRLFH